jgi:hypothetical protein
MLSKKDHLRQRFCVRLERGSRSRPVDAGILPRSRQIGVQPKGEYRKTRRDNTVHDNRFGRRGRLRGRRGVFELSEVWGKFGEARNKMPSVAGLSMGGVFLRSGNHENSTTKWPALCFRWEFLRWRSVCESVGNAFAVNSHATPVVVTNRARTAASTIV